MDKLGWKGRLAVVLSGLWLLAVYSIAPADDVKKIVVAIGLLPLGVLWGVAWAIQGYRRQHQSSDAPKTNWTSLALRWLLGLLILTAGYTAAHQFMGDGAAHLAGYWLAYAMLFYVAVRFVPKASSHAVLWTITAYAAAISVDGYLSYREVQQAKQEIANAAPLLLRIASGEAVSDGEIVRAKAGRLESFVRASATYGSEQVAAMQAYSDDVAALKLEQLLQPQVLGDLQGRKLVASRMQLFDQAVIRLESGLKANWQRFENQASLLAAQLPPQMGAGLKEGLLERYARARPILDGWIASQRQVQAHTLELTRFLDRLGPKVVLVRNPPNLMFRDEYDLTNYRSMMGKFADLALKEDSWRQKMLDDERQGAQKLVDFVQSSK